MSPLPYLLSIINILICDSFFWSFFLLMPEVFQFVFKYNFLIILVNNHINIRSVFAADVVCLKAGRGGMCHKMK